MERIIEFRGQHVHVLPENKHLDKTWVYGHLSSDDYISVTYEDGTYAEKLVDKNSIGQYIGEQDKDKNKIYELDIVELENPCAGKLHWLVIFENGEFHLTSKFPDTYDRLDISNYDIVWGSLKIIGNYIDNPELLEE